MLKTAVAEVSELKPGLVLIRFGEGVSVEASHADEIVQAVRTLTKGQIHANLTDARELHYMSNEARERFGSHDGQGLVAVAIVVSSRLQTTMANLYLLIGKPKYPTKVFSSFEVAAHWLEQQLRNPATAVLSA